MKKNLCLCLALLLGLMLTAGCSAQPSKDGGASAPGPDQTNAQGSEPSPAAEPMKLVVAQMGQSIKPAAVVLAQQLGYFEQEGLEVAFEQISNLYDASTALTEGKLDVLPFGMIPACTYVAQGADITMIGGTITGASACVALPQRAEEFQNLDGFRGKTIACVRPETGHMYMMDVLRKAGIVPGTDVTFVELDSMQSVTQAVLKGEADAGFVNAFTQTAVSQGLQVAFEVTEYAPDAVCCRQSTSGAAIREKREALVRFEIALLRAYDVFRNDPEQAVSILAAFSGQDEEYTRAYLYEDSMIVSLDPAADRVVEFYEVMRANGDLAEGTTHNMEDHVDSSIYQEALETMVERQPENALWQELMEAFEKNNQGA